MAAQPGAGSPSCCPPRTLIWVGEELPGGSGCPYWQFAVRATDANQFAIRLARHLTGRPKILVFNWCYHGTVDETFITLTGGMPGTAGEYGPPVDPAVTTRVVDSTTCRRWKRRSPPGDVACVLAEPAMTNIGIIHPDPGYHDALRDHTGGPAPC